MDKIKELSLEMSDMISSAIRKVSFDDQALNGSENGSPDSQMKMKKTTVLTGNH